MSEIEIEHGIPVPSKIVKGQKWKELLAEMKVGDSVVVSINQSYALQYAAKRRGLKITCATISYNKRRCWLVGETPGPKR